METEWKCIRCGNCCQLAVEMMGFWKDGLNPEQIDILLLERKSYPEMKGYCTMCVEERDGLFSCLNEKVLNVKPKSCSDYKGFVLGKTICGDKTFTKICFRSRLD